MSVDGAPLRLAHPAEGLPGVESNSSFFWGLECYVRRQVDSSRGAFRTARRKAVNLLPLLDCDE